MVPRICKIELARGVEREQGREGEARSGADAVEMPRCPAAGDGHDGRRGQVDAAYRLPGGIGDEDAAVVGGDSGGRREPGQVPRLVHHRASAGEARQGIHAAVHEGNSSHGAVPAVGDVDELAIRSGGEAVGRVEEREAGNAVGRTRRSLSCQDAGLRSGRIQHDPADDVLTRAASRRASRRRRRGRRPGPIASRAADRSCGWRSRRWRTGQPRRAPVPAGRGAPRRPRAYRPLRWRGRACARHGCPCRPRKPSVARARWRRER